MAAGSGHATGGGAPRSVLCRLGCWRYFVGDVMTSGWSHRSSNPAAATRGSSGRGTACGGRSSCSTPCLHEKPPSLHREPASFLRPKPLYFLFLFCPAHLSLFAQGTAARNRCCGATRRGGRTRTENLSFSRRGRCALGLDVSWSCCNGNDYRRRRGRLPRFESWFCRSRIRRCNRATLREDLPNFSASICVRVPLLVMRATFKRALNIASSSSRLRRY